MTTLRVVKRDDKTFNLAFTNSSTGLPIDLTGYHIFFTVKTEATVSTDPDSSAIIKKDITPSVPATAGLAVVALTHTDTDVPAGTYYFDVELVAPDGTVTTPITLGDFRVIQDVTVRTS